jgi:hypothetical protein
LNEERLALRSACWRLSEKRVIFNSVISERYRVVDTPRMLDNDDPRFVLVTVIRKGDTALPVSKPMIRMKRAFF